MKPGSELIAKPSIAILLQGAPFAGKSTLAMKFPNPYVLDFDDKLVNVLKSLPTGKQFWYDCPLRKPDGTPVPDEMRWETAVNYLKEALVSKVVETIVIDSVTSLGAMLMEHILRFPSTAKTPLMVGGKKVMDQSMWLPFRDILTKMIMACRASGKMVIFTAHDVADKDEVTGVITYKPSFSGQLKDTAAGLFTDLWHCESELVPNPAKPGTMMSKFVVSTQATARLALGSALGLPPKFEFSWELFQKYLPKANDTVAAPVQPAP